ncbi:MAG: hypothetical protein ACOZBW_14270 [Thermodesulfobacteriota bacterium]
MRVGTKHSMTLLAVSAAVCMALALGGCAAFQSKDKGKSATSAPKPAPAAQPQASSRPTSVYYDFQDVLFPVEMKLDKNQSSVYVTDGFKTGVLKLSGGVEAGSLVTWFENNMVKDNWRLIGSLRARRTLLLFVKQNRYCVISVTDGMMKTYAEVWVAPTVNDIQESGRLQ